MEKLDIKDTQTLNIIDENIKQLKEIFPEVFREDKVDFDRLQELLGNYVNDSEENYNFTWHGKRRAARLAQTPSTGTLRPCKEESVDFDKTQNLFIEGDNLEVLKLLQKSYHRKVKMIYIDPPYNTGNDFVYEDDFKDGVKHYLEVTNQIDSEGKKLGTNSSSTGRYHTNWLNMMYPRLKLARNLLRDDGVIFVSIDDNEEANLVHILREVFGEENYLANIAWKHTQQSKNDEPYFSKNKNSILVFRKSYNVPSLRLPRTDEDNKNYSNPDNDPNGDWRSGDVRSPSYRSTLRFDIKTPSGKIINPPDNGWRWSEEVIKEKISSGEIIFSQDEARIVRKIYLINQNGRTPENVWSGDRFGTTRGANNLIKRLFEDRVPFDTPKPVELIETILNLMHYDKEFVVLDFFAGSGTTAHAVMKLNAEDNGNRRHISVQLPEKTDEKSEAFKAGYKNIAEIAKERIRRAAKKIKEENPDYKGDLGFKVFKLDSSNIKTWEAGFDSLEQDLMGAVDYIKQDRSKEDILYELLLKYGLDLAVPIEAKNIAGKTVYSVGVGALIVCLESDISADVVNGIVELKEQLRPEVTRVVFKDSSFKDDVVKTNALQILKRAGIEDVKSL